MSEKGKADRELASEESEKGIVEKVEKVEENYENAKSPLWQKFNSYQKNLLCVRDVTDRLFRHMKGHSVSFKPEITDRKGKFSEEKLSGFVEGLLSRWAAKQRDGTYTDPSTGESMAEPYIQERQELYGCYLYMVMRCSLWKGGYNLVGGGEEERTDFAFLLEQAEKLLRAWCVMKELDGSKKNELFWGYDGHFGLHLYRFLSCPKAGYNNGFDRPGRLPVDNPAFMTDEGNVKRNQFKSIYISGRPEVLEEREDEAAQPEENIHNMEGNRDDENGYDIGDGHNEDDYGDGIDGAFVYEDGDCLEEHDALWHEEEAHWIQKQMDIEYLVLNFEHQDEYVKKCERFVDLFRQAGHDVLREFCGDLEEIVALYLVEKDIPPMMDTDKALDVYSGINDGPYRRAARYARGLQWKNL